MNSKATPAAQGNDSGTDVAEFISDLDGGALERKLSLSLSEVAAAVVDNDRGGEVTLKLNFKRIPGTTQVHCEHTLEKINIVRPHEIKLTTTTDTYTRIILDKNSIRALRTALSKMPDDIDGLCKITCYPLYEFESTSQELEAA